MQLRFLRPILAAILVVAAAVVPVSADPVESPVAEWNRHATVALFNGPSAAVPGAGQPPTVGVLHLAMVQGAVYDAVNSIVGGYQPYLSGLPSAPASANQAAAVATAAHHVLVGVPLGASGAAIRTRLDTEYAASLSEIPDGAAKDAGIAAGTAAATAMLLERTGDGRFPTTAFFFTQGTQIGEWRSTTPGATDLAAWVAHVTPFVVKSSSQFRSDGPLDIGSAEYAAEYNEVKALGAKDGSSRTEAQTTLANFFVPNPVEMYNRAFRGVAASQGLSTADEARLFARINLAGADSLITCWDDKVHWSFWRPVTAIHQGDSDGNDATVGDTAWEPLIANPPYPDHPSGYNCLTGGVMHAATDFFGPKRVGITLAHAAGTPTRQYVRFTDVIKDTIDARIYLGIHFRTPDVQGAIIGKKVAHWLDRHALQEAP